jgi:hypothetical protein
MSMGARCGCEKSVGARAVSAHHGVHRGRAELQPLQRAKLGFDLPPFLVGGVGKNGVQHFAPARPVETLAYRFQQAAAEIAVQVDHTRQYRLARAIDRCCRGVRGAQGHGGTHRHDAAALDGNGRSFENAPPGVHRDDEPVVEQ